MPFDGTQLFKKLKTKLLAGERINTMEPPTIASSTVVTPAVSSDEESISDVASLNILSDIIEMETNVLHSSMNSQQSITLLRQLNQLKQKVLESSGGIEYNEEDDFDDKSSMSSKASKKQLRRGHVGVIPAAAATPPLPPPLPAHVLSPAMTSLHR